MISTRKRHRIEPWAYLPGVLARTPQQPADKLDELLPDQWNAEQGQRRNHNPTASQHIGMVPSVPANDAAQTAMPHEPKPAALSQGACVCRQGELQIQCTLRTRV
jgi:hypothetical protein